jgi:flagellin
MSRINTNIPSLTAARILGKNNQSLNTTLNRLSTGLRIISGKDDPAGLIASETLRSEKTAISAAIDNARRADNIVSVAEGALQEVSALLIDLEDLVDHSANDAGISSDEVQANQLQIDSILDSINRIANSTAFQGKKLLNGNLDYTTSGLQAAAIDGVQINGARLPDGGSKTVLVQVTASAETARVNYTGASVSAITISVGGSNGTELFSFASGTTIASIATAINGAKELTGVSATVASAGSLAFNSTGFGSSEFVTVNTVSGNFTVTGGDAGSNKDFGKDVAATVNGTQAITNGLKASVRSTTLAADFVLDSTFAQAISSTSFSITGGGANFSLAPEIGLVGQASLGIKAVNSSSLGDAALGFLSSLGSGQGNQLTAKNFATAQDIIRAANKQVSSLRGRLGAFSKNTLQSTINSLQVALENTTAAESSIRDADFAEETSKLTRAQILVNSSTAVLQLANAAPQNVLALLG